MQLNPYKCSLINDFELYNVHIKNTDNEKWFILNNKIDYVEPNRK